MPLNSMNILSVMVASDVERAGASARADGIMGKEDPSARNTEEDATVDAKKLRRVVVSDKS